MKVSELVVGEVVEDWAADARFHEYTQAADPLGRGHITPVPPRTFSPELHTLGHGTRVVPLDLARELGTPYPATSPALLAQFVVVEAGDSLTTADAATSELLYCLRGRGRTTAGRTELDWATGDVVTLPGSSTVTHTADTASAFYRVTDAPLLAYLGVRPGEARFAPTVFTRAAAQAALAQVATAPDAATRNRVSVLLGNARFDQTLTATHTLWAMYGTLPARRDQLPHRHQSVALDLIVDCPPGCYTLVGEDVDPATGQIVDPLRIAWEPGGAFVTPPGLWHSHHNPTVDDAYLLPIQDAGLHTYLRSLDIRFTR